MRGINTAHILLLIREGNVYDWETLCRAFGMSPQAVSTNTYVLARAIYELHEAGLIALEDNIDPYNSEFPKGRIQLSPGWGRIQNALRLSLKELAQVRPDRSMLIEPLFGRPSKTIDSDKLDFFMLMPFRPELKPIYDDHVKTVVQDLGLTIRRGDDFFTTHHIIQDIWQSICTARAIIADCTGRNPNVFYEIGIAHTIGKPVILITQNSEDVPFDLRHIRYIQYQYTPPGMKQFEQTLEATIKQLLDSNP